MLSLRRYTTLIFNPNAPAAIRRLPRYVRDWQTFVRDGRARLRLDDAFPCLTDAKKETPFDAHYLYQGAWLARHLARLRPVSHVDVGSDVDVVSVLSAFVPVRFIDYRPLKVSLPGLTCDEGDILQLPLASGSAPSVSCLHVIEHVGLGRYGDSIDPDGSVKAAGELRRVVAPGGSLFVTVPVGRARVCFNAHRVFAPATVVDMFWPLSLVEFSYVDDRAAFHESVALEAAAGCEYGCGMFRFAAR